MTIHEALTDQHPPVQLSREQILQATSRCLRDYGYDATTIRKIAGALGCAVGSIYRYFRDKRELLSAVSQMMLEPVAAMVGSGEGFEQSVRMYHQLVTHAPETYRLMFWLAGPEQDSPAAAPRLPDVVQQVVDGWSRQLDDTEAARRCWAILHGYVLLGRSAEDTLAAMRSTAGAQPATPGSGDGNKQPHVVITLAAPPRSAGATVSAGAAKGGAEDLCLL